MGDSCATGTISILQLRQNKFAIPRILYLYFNATTIKKNLELEIKEQDAIIKKNLESKIKEDNTIIRKNLELAIKKNDAIIKKNSRIIKKLMKTKKKKKS